MWYIITLSALFYSSAFFVHGAEFLMLFFPIPLAYGLSKTTRLCQAFGYGVLWGSIVFGSVSVWVLLVLCRYAGASLLSSLALYGVAISYFAFTVALWFMALWRWLQWYKGSLWRAMIARWVGVVILGFGYFVCVERWILFPLGKLEGYPFIMPYVPLAGYKPFLQMCAMLGCWCSGVFVPVSHTWRQNVDLVYISPIINKQQGRLVYANNPCAVGQEIYRRLCTAKQRVNNNNKDTIFVGPESIYPFVLNNHQEQVSLWTSTLDERQHLLLGSYYEINGKLYQTVFQWDKSRIMHFYVKKHCVPFVEKIHTPWRNLLQADQLFLKGLRFFSRGKQHIGDEVLSIDCKIDVIPQICSEIFMKTTREEIELKKCRCTFPVVFVFVNDSWFAAYFKRLMHMITQLKSAWWGVDIVYIGHDELIFFTTK